MKTNEITGRLDHVFLSIVTFDNDYLKEIISEVLNIRVKKAKIINSKMAKRRIVNRASYLDLVVETEIGYINIEIANCTYDKYTAHRNFVYLNNLVTNVTKEGMQLDEMPKVIQINLIFGQTPRKIESSIYKVYSKKEEKILTEKFEIYNVYVDKLKKIYYNNNKLTNKPALIALSMTKSELEERKDENMFYEKLYQKLDEMEDTGLAPELMPIEKENEWHQRMMIKSAKEEGLEQGTRQNKIETVINMLKKKFNTKIISEITGVSKKEIEKIAKTQNY